MTTVFDIPASPVRENVARLKARLRRCPEAIQWLLQHGIRGETIDRLHLGLKEPYTPRDGGDVIRDPLCYPLLDAAMKPASRYAYLRVPTVTDGGPTSSSWGPGQVATYRLGAASRGLAIVASNILDCWLAWQEAASERTDFVFLGRTKTCSVPAEWRTPQFWEEFENVVVLPGSGSADLLRDLAPYVQQGLRSLRLPVPHETLRDAVSMPGFDLAELALAAPIWIPDVVAPRDSIPDSAVGRFAAEAVEITGAHINGHSYYPFSLEARTIEGSTDGGRVVQSYEVQILRSDGQLLEVISLPAPRGTDVRSRVLALSDGTRILSRPEVGQRSTWSFRSIQNFIEWRRGGAECPHRDIGDVLRDVERYVRSRVWLPGDEHYILAASYIALSHVYQVFDAIPLLLITGPSGTGKSELAEAICRLGFNAVMAGQLRAAGMIRLLDETRGLLVLDDVDGKGQASITGSGELAQTLKTSYKRSSARKPLADRTGRVRMADFYGPKVLTNVSGADHVLGSRLLCVRTAVPAVHLELKQGDWDGATLDALRDELHSWALAEAATISRIYRGLPMAHNRRDEIKSPMIAIARATGCPEIAARMDRLLERCDTFWHAT